MNKHNDLATKRKQYNALRMMYMQAKTLTKKGYFLNKLKRLDDEIFNLEREVDDESEQTSKKN